MTDQKDVRDISNGVEQRVILLSSLAIDSFWEPEQTPGQFALLFPQEIFLSRTISSPPILMLVLVLSPNQSFSSSQSPALPSTTLALWLTKGCKRQVCSGRENEIVESNQQNTRCIDYFQYKVARGYPDTKGLSSNIGPSKMSEIAEVPLSKRLNVTLNLEGDYLFSRALLSNIIV